MHATPGHAPSDADRLSPAFSVWLDLLRVMAALTVLVAHAANLRFTGGFLYDVREWTLAPDAVIVFFVLSGLVIARAAERDALRDPAGGAYAFNRLTRLWSVILPALFLTLACDALGRAIDPGAYRSLHYNALPPGEFLLRGITLTQEWRELGGPEQLGSNAPLWSLSFEAAYYAGLGIVVFLRGVPRVFALAALVTAVGLPVAALAPAWLAGVAVWHLGPRLPPLPRTAMLALAILPIALLAGLKIADTDGRLLELTRDLLDTRRPREILGYGQEALWSLVIAACVGLHLLAMARVAPRLPARLAGAIRWLAGASFSIYVVHYPVMHLLDAVLPEDGALRPVLFLALPLAAGLAFAEVFERRLPALRARLGRARRPRGA